MHNNKTKKKLLSSPDAATYFIFMDFWAEQKGCCSARLTLEQKKGFKKQA